MQRGPACCNDDFELCYIRSNCDSTMPTQLAGVELFEPPAAAQTSRSIQRLLLRRLHASHIINSVVASLKYAATSNTS